MKRLLASLRTGALSLAHGPAPPCPPGGVLIAVTRSLVSAGTERMMVDFGRASLLAKARAQPDRVAQTLAKVRTDGFAATLGAVRAKLDQPVPLGYSAVGRVVESDTADLAPGARVVTNQPHADYATAMPTTAARIPDTVSDDHAAFAVVGAIGLNGIRLIAPTLGESVVVMGLGLIGLIAAQLLRAGGARVLGIDPDPARRALGEALGIATIDNADPVAAARAFSRAPGVDAVLITAATTSRTLIRDAAHMCRARGRIVLTGVAPLTLAREDFYAKELSFQVSAAYGPGRYDPAYEARGQDYPLAHVRWTMLRNMEAVLDQIAERRIEVAPLISHRFAFADAPRAYDLLTGPEPSLGILLDYPAPQDATPVRVLHRMPAADAQAGGISVIGAGEYAARTLLPAFAAAGARFRVIVDRGGARGPALARRHDFAVHASDPEAAFADPGTSAIVIATRHDSHADLVVATLEAGHAVFVEKPLALTIAEIDRVEAARAASGQLLCVGFNRRFSPHVVALKAALVRASAPPAMVMHVNAGTLSATHWAAGEGQGGRVAGEACHFIDLLRHLAGAPIASVSVDRLRAALVADPGDVVTISLSFANGAIGTVHYFANGHPRLPKERLELFAGGRVYMLDNFRRTRALGDPAFRTITTGRADKGQARLAGAFLAAVAGQGPPPIPVDELFEVARATVLAADLAR